MNDFEALLVQIVQQSLQRMRGRGLNVVHQDDALLVDRELAHDPPMDGLAVAGLEILGVDVDRKDRDIAGAGVFNDGAAFAQKRKPEERRDGASQGL